MRLKRLGILLLSSIYLILLLIIYQIPPDFLPKQLYSENQPKQLLDRGTTSKKSQIETEILNLKAWPNPLFTSWSDSKFSTCEGRFEGYAHEFARIYNVMLDRSLAIGPMGGQDMESLMGQQEAKEYYTYTNGLFKLACKGKIEKYYFGGKGNYLNEWMKSVKYVQNVTQENVFVNERLTIAVKRYEYVNLYHSMTYWYNMFLMLTFFNQSAAQTDILFIDAHPKGSLDHVYSTLFHSCSFLSQISGKVLYKQLIWVMQGYSSPLLEFKNNNFPLGEEFREFFLHKHKMDPSHVLSCKNISVSFIWRRDYVAHPRNAKGLISRKIRNEGELIQHLKNKFPSFVIKGSQLDLYPMKKQLDFVSKSDILIGMHGAGLTHALFLPKHSGLIELYPNYWSNSSSHMKLIASRRNLLYAEWKNSDPKNELNHKFTIVPPETVSSLVEKIVEKMCSK